MKKILGVGNKARNGKDTLASMIQELRENTVIIHFADALYAEAHNESEFPLVQKCYDQYFFLDSITQLNRIDSFPNYKEFSAEEVPQMHEYFTNKGIDIYWRMKEKDAQFLQCWGTGFRRNLCNINYWIDQVLNKISASTIENPLFIIPDTRFKNEYDCIKNAKGYYCRVIRKNPDGTQFIDQSRDPMHPSETDLDQVKCDFEVVADSGDLATIRNRAIEILKTIDNGF